MNTITRELILDCSHYSGTDLDKMIVDYAETHYMYRLPNYPDPNDTEGWQYDADDALMWMNTTEEELGKFYEIEDNCLFLVSEGE